MQAVFPGDTSVVGPGGGPAPWRLSLVFPARNAEATIGQAVREAEGALAAVTAAYEIIVVDDGSSDSTAEVVNRLAAVNPRVRLLRQGYRQGYGAALRTGCEAARLDLVAITDPDGACAVGDLAYLLPLTARYDVACGYRIDRPGSVLNRLGSWSYNTLLHALLRSPVRDIGCALKVFRREQLSELLPDSDHSFASAEMVLKAQHAGRTVVEVGVHYRPHAGGRGATSWRELPRTLLAGFSFAWSHVLFPAAERPETGPIGWFWFGLVVLALVAGGLLFPNLSYPLMEPDEGRYAEIAREMATTGDWIMPTLNHQPYLDKPPLLYWLTAGCLRLFGTHEWVVRLVPSLAAFGTVFALYLLGRRLLGTRTAFLAALLLSLTAGLVHCGRFLILDSLLTFLVTLALLAAYRAVQRPRVRWRWWLTAGVLSGLGVLTKGPVALVLLLPPVAGYAWLTRSKARPTAMHWAVLLAVALAVAAPWYAAMTLRDPGFAHYFIVEQHVRRFLSEDYHAGPAWFYVPVVLVGCLPWAGLLLPVSRFLFCRAAEVRALRSPALGFFLLWAGWCFAFFSLSRGKLPPYLLPALPALAALAGAYLERVLFPPAAGLFSEGRGRLPWLGVAVLALGWLGVDAWAWRCGLAGPAGWRVLVPAVLCVGGLVAAAVGRRQLPWQTGWALCAVLGVGVLLETADQFVPAWARQHAPTARSAEVADLLRDRDTGVLCVGEEWGSVSFRVDDDSRFVNGTGWSADELRRVLARHSRNLMVIKDDLGDRVEDLVIRRSLPDGMEITRVLHSGRAKFLVLARRGQ